MGRFGRRGSGVLISTSGGYGIDRKPAAAPHLRKRPARVINMSQLGMALEETGAPEIRVLFVYNSNPVATAPNQQRVIRAMSRDSLFTVVHEQIWTDTCDFADLVLPATTFLEHQELSRATAATRCSGAILLSNRPEKRGRTIGCLRDLRARWALTTPNFEKAKRISFDLQFETSMK